MFKLGHCLGAFSLLLILATGTAAAPAPDRFALVLGESTYANLPHLPGCAVSAQVIGDRLRALGFDVAEQTDASNGQISAALIELASRAATVSDPTLVIYFCGYQAGLDNRLFLLPVEAALARPSDLLTQGLPAQSLLDVANSKTRVGLSVLDTYAQPSAQPAAAGAITHFVAGQTLAEGHIALVAAEGTVVTTSTPLGESLAAALAVPPVDLDQATASIRKDLAGRATLATAGSGAGLPLLRPPAKPPAPPPVAAAPAPPATTAPKPAASAPPQASTAAASPPTPAVVMPMEAEYSVLDRRRVQGALRQLGYYDGDVDGVFGSETRAAIRRYQHEIGAPMTGTLTPEEAERLLAGLAKSGQ